MSRTLVGGTVLAVILSAAGAGAMPRASVSIESPGHCVGNRFEIMCCSPGAPSEYIVLKRCIPLTEAIRLKSCYDGSVTIDEDPTGTGVPTPNSTCNPFLVVDAGCFPCLGSSSGRILIRPMPGFDSQTGNCTAWNCAELLQEAECLKCDYGIAICEPAGLSDCADL